MAAIYKHGTYGEFASSIGGTAAQSGTVAVYVGAAPVNLVRGYKAKDVVNMPVLLTNFASAKRYMGYSSDWEKYSLCEAIKVHFDNVAGNAGPIVAINVLDPEKHVKDGAITQTIAFVNGRATIVSDTIILDTLALSDKVEGVDYSVEYDFASGKVIIDSVGAKITGSVQATFSEVDTSKITKTEIIGGVTDEGAYTGLGAIDLVYQYTSLIPNILAVPGWSDVPEVYTAMIYAATQINGHWEAFVVADLPLIDVDTIDKAIQWAEDNGYKNERSKIYWPMFADADGVVYHGSTLAAWKMQVVDGANNGIPMETPSNKAVPVAKQYFGAGSTNRGFDQTRANELNANGISTAVFWGGQWVLWGGHTAAYKFGEVSDNRVIFDNNIRMMMHILNSFQKEWAVTIDRPMTIALAESIKNREQEKADALCAVGALVGTPIVEFVETENSDQNLIEGNFVWDFDATPTPQFKAGTIRVAYTDAGFSSIFEEV
jgi:phage tail sheath protein FI